MASVRYHLSPSSLFLTVDLLGALYRVLRGALQGSPGEKTREEIILEPYQSTVVGSLQGNCKELCMGRWLGVVCWKRSPSCRAMQVWLISKIIHTFTRDLFRVSSKQNGRCFGGYFLLPQSLPQHHFEVEHRLFYCVVEVIQIKSLIHVH